MHKRKLHHFWTKIRWLRSWYFLLAAIVFGAVFIFAYRQNNLKALELRDKVLKVDEQNGDVEAALKELREFTYSHMNARLEGGEGAIYPPIQLKYRYERLVAAEKERVKAANANVYTDAQANCEKLYPGSFSGGPRVPCIENYVTTHTATEKPIPDALYKFDFISPSWSPDRAGWSILAAISFSVLFAVRLILEIWVKLQLRRQA